MNTIWFYNNFSFQIIIKIFLQHILPETSILSLFIKKKNDKVLVDIEKNNISTRKVFSKPNIFTLEMLTYEYKPDQEKIKARSQIEIFGNIAQSSASRSCSSKLPAPKFHLKNEPQDKVDVYQYVPSFQSSSEYLTSNDTPFTLRVFNIPKTLKKRELIDLIASKLDDPIFYCNIVNDRESGHFIGVAYLKFDNEQIARKSMKVLDGIQIGDCLLGVDVAKRQF